MTRRHLLVHGCVQGVGFRWFAKDLADSLGLSGWVCNRKDGMVEAEIEGETAVVDEFIQRLSRENPAARVDDIVATPVAARGGNGFAIISALTEP